MVALRRITLGLVAALAALLLCAGAASASSFTSLYNEYRSTGTISPCKHSTSELQSGVSQVPPDISQYAPDFPAALQSALQARASGACSGKKDTAAPAPATPAGGSSGAGGAGGGATHGAAPTHNGTPVPPSAPAQSPATIARTASSGREGGASSAPAPVIVLAVLMGLLAIAALWWMLAAARGQDPRWLGPARHALAEAGFRAEGALEEFGDWLRLGR